MKRIALNSRVLFVLIFIVLPIGCFAVILTAGNDPEEHYWESIKGWRKLAPRMHTREKLSTWWDPIPESVLNASLSTGPTSNIHPGDYAGPESCRSCHREHYKGWSKHPHRWMNALADEATVKGDFTGNAGITHLGADVTFYREAGEFRMRVEHGSRQRVYLVRQTIGSRFYQYYAGRLLAGPEPTDHAFYQNDYVLPYGYWLEPKEWVPIVHVGGDEHEIPDGKRAGPIDQPQFVNYAHSCNVCHTTFPLGDQFLRDPVLKSRHSHVSLVFSHSGYLGDVYPQLWESGREPHTLLDHELVQLDRTVKSFKAPDHAVTLGVSCEACHLGLRKHVEDKQTRPEFFPRSPHLYVQAQKGAFSYGRVRENLNWACGRCHSGDRSQFPAGMSTRNSGECDDMMRSACSSKITCVDCHNPHQGIGRKWPRTPEKDDATCLKCHQKYESEESRLKHTHHPLGSSGNRCMNCHMPRINEGLQDVVRTHMIFSPTHKDMIEANHANACNLCHVEQPIDWTLKHLDSWYGARFSEAVIESSYPNRQESTAVGWLNSGNESLRLVAADALTRAGARWALPKLLDALDDPYLLNRQFARIGLEKMLDVELVDYGYRFYMTPDERREPLKQLRAALLP